MRFTGDTEAPPHLQSGQEALSKVQSGGVPHAHSQLPPSAEPCIVSSSKRSDIAIATDDTEAGVRPSVCTSNRDDELLLVPEDMLADHWVEYMDIFEALWWRTKAWVERANTIAKKQIHCAFQQPAAIATNCTGQ